MLVQVSLYLKPHSGMPKKYVYLVASNNKKCTGEKYYVFVIFLKIDKMCLEIKLFHLSRSTAFPAIKHVCPAKIQISMCIQADQCLRCPPRDALDSWLPKVCPAKTLARLH